MIYNHQAFQEIKNVYSEKRLRGMVDRAKRRLIEAEGNIADYMSACKKQMEVIENTDITNHVYLHRRKSYATNRIKFSAGVLYYPDIENGERHGWTDRHKVFAGRERGQARKYAEVLAGELNCEIREAGF